MLQSNESSITLKKNSRRTLISGVGALALLAASAFVRASIVDLGLKMPCSTSLSVDEISLGLVGLRL